MGYAILTNPRSGRLSLRQKIRLLEKAARILDAGILGLDIETKEGFASCARQIASSADTLVVAGGDGTLSDAINAVDTSRTPIAYLPLGSGNALAHGLKSPLGIARAARRIKEGRTREFDLILCDGRKRAFLASVGIEGSVLRLRDHYLGQGVKGLTAYSRAFFEVYFHPYHPFSLDMEVDGQSFSMRRVLSVSILKQAYYGYGMNLIPHARMDDGKLHILCAKAGLSRTFFTVLTAFTIGNRIGIFLEGRKVSLRLDRPVALQTDGDLAWEANSFTFEVLPRALKLKC